MLYFDEKLMQLRGHLIKHRLMIDAVENFLCMVSIVLLSMYINRDMEVKWPFVLLVPIFAMFVNFLAVDYDCTPANSTYIVCMRMIIVLRFLLLSSIILKCEGVTTWKWASILWPFWCSLAIQSIVNMAVLVITVQNLFSWMYKPCEELN
jgi:hypothetical protein